MDPFSKPNQPGIATPEKSWDVDRGWDRREEGRGLVSKQVRDKCSVRSQSGTQRMRQGGKREKKSEAGGPSGADFDTSALSQDSEKGEDALVEGSVEGVDVGHALSVVEAKLTPFIVQVDTEAPGPLAG